MNITGKRIAVLVADDFEDIELTEPREELAMAGAETFIIGIEAGVVVKGKHGTTVEVEQAAAEVSEFDFDLLLVPGGQGPEKLRLDAGVLDLVRRFDDAGKPIAAICHAPLVLVSAGRADGRRMTAYRGVREDVANAGAEGVDEPVVIDGNIITSRNPEDIPQFVEAIVEILQ